MLSSRWAQAGLRWRDWSAATFCHVVADLVAQAAEEQGGDAAGRALARDRAQRRYEDPDRVGTLSADEAARILASGS